MEMSRADAPGSVLARAAVALREHTDEGWLAISSKVLAAAVSAFRPTRPIRALDQDGQTFVAEQVVISYLYSAISDIDDVAPAHIAFGVDENAELTSVLVEIVVLFATPIVPAAAQVRAAAAERLAAILGYDTPPYRLVEVNVHVGDVTDDSADL